MSNDRLPSSSEASSWPLSIPTVLECVQENLNNKDLFRCRLVCQSWAREAGRIIGKRLEEKLRSFDQLEILRKIQKCGDIALTLQKLTMKIPNGYNIQNLPNHSYGTVNSLNLECCPSLVPHILFKRFPNLKSLCYISQLNSERKQIPEVPFADVSAQSTLSEMRSMELFEISLKGDWINLWMTLVEKAVNLKSLGVSTSRIASILITKVCSPYFKTLAIVEYFNSEALLFALPVHAIKFPLETIKLDCIEPSTISKSGIKRLLNLYSSTLKQLVLCFDDDYEMNFPLRVRMEKLHTLETDNLSGSIEWEYLPQLKKLDMTYNYLEGIASSIPSSPPFSHLKVLMIADIRDEDERCAPIFRKISEYLGPQLKVLALEVDNTNCEPLLPVIFTKLTQLTNLTLLRYIDVPLNITNNNLCGGGYFTFERPSEGTHGSALKTLYQRMIASAKKSNHVRGPNITDLKDLQFLSMDGTFNEVAVLHGIVQCEKLRELNLKFPDDEMTRDSIVHLLVNAGLEHLTSVELNGERINHLSFAPKAPRAVNGQRE